MGAKPRLSRGVKRHAPMLLVEGHLEILKWARSQGCPFSVVVNYAGLKSIVAKKQLC